MALWLEAARPRGDSSEITSAPTPTTLSRGPTPRSLGAVGLIPTRTSPLCLFLRAARLDSRRVPKMATYQFVSASSDCLSRMLIRHLRRSPLRYQSVQNPTVFPLLRVRPTKPTVRLSCTPIPETPTSVWQGCNGRRYLSNDSCYQKSRRCPGGPGLATRHDGHGHRWIWLAQAAGGVDRNVKKTRLLAGFFTRFLAPRNAPEGAPNHINTVPSLISCFDATILPRRI